MLYLYYLGYVCPWQTNGMKWEAHTSYCKFISLFVFFKERRSEAQVQKEEGNDFFKKQEYELANKSYSRALKLCPKDFVKDRAILFSNRAACRMKKVSTDENHRCTFDIYSFI